MAHDARRYGEGVAGDYDELYESIPGTDDAVATLAQLACGGPVLELGIGTGRLALPLLECGLRVHGVEASEAMVEQLRAKPRGEEIPVTVGDYGEVVAGEGFGLVVLALNGIFALESQASQVGCFKNAARQLRPGGRFVVEAFVLDEARLQGGEAIQARFMDAERLELQVLRYDPVEQVIDRMNVNIREEGTRLVPIRDRYAHPSELDLMAELAGLRLHERWDGWSRDPFTASSRGHVSVYER